MNYLIKSNWYEYLNKHWCVNPSASGLRVDILKKLLSQLNQMIERHRKVFIFRFDLSMNDYSLTNALITKLIKSIKGKVNNHYDCELTYTWVREQERSKSQHYHVVFMLDGSKINNPHKVKEWLVMIWERFGRCCWVKYYVFNRSDIQTIEDVSYHISYLAKPRGKGKRPAQTKDFGGSRVKKGMQAKVRKREKEVNLDSSYFEGISFLKNCKT